MILRHSNSTSIRTARVVRITFRKRVLIKTIMTREKSYTSKIKQEIRLKKLRISIREITIPSKINSREASTIEMATSWDTKAIRAAVTILDQTLITLPPRITC